MVMTNVSNEVCDWLHKNKEAMRALVEGRAAVVPIVWKDKPITHAGYDYNEERIEPNFAVTFYKLGSIRLDHPTGKE